MVSEAVGDPNIAHGTAIPVDAQVPSLNCPLLCPLPETGRRDMSGVVRHYGPGDVVGRIRAALEAAGLERPILPAALAPLDQFHMRGLAATEELAAALRLHAAARVLDVGCGLGGPSRVLASRFGCTVEGIDLSASFIAAATLLAEMTELAPRVAYRVADALALPYDDGSFDVVWTQHVAMNIADPARLYGEMRRVLVPGGRLALYDVIAGPGGEPHFPVPWARDAADSHLLAESDLRAVLDAAGFVAMEWEDRTRAALEWAARQAMAAAIPKSPLGLHIAMGPDFPALSANFVRNLREDRTRLLQAVLKAG
jgi:SAM-dependent methyltransferase